MNKTLSLLAFGAAFALAAPALAQVKLVASTPAANKAAAKPMAVSLTFSDKIASSSTMDIVMLTMPGLGAWADRRAAKKRLLAMVTVGCVLSTAALAAVGPGAVAWAIVGIIVGCTQPANNNTCLACAWVCGTAPAGRASTILRCKLCGKNPRSDCPSL